MACLSNLVTLGVCPDESESLSGFALVDAGGMSIRNFANIANETYKNGIDMAMAKKSLTEKQIRNDFIAELQKRNVIAQVVNPEYDAARFNTTKPVGTYAGYRGLVIHKNSSWKGGLRKTYIKQVEVYPYTSGDSTISIIDGNNEYVWDVELVANQINIFTSEQLSGLPYIMVNKSVQVLIDQTDISFASTDIICRTGCGGTVPNNCAWVEGWTGTAQTRSEGYGMNVVFYCLCDYESIICSNYQMFGELFWIKWQMNIFDEQFKTNRFNDLVIYSSETIDKVIMPDLSAQYAQKWEGMLAGLKGILDTYKDGCLNCQGIRYVTNV